MTTELLLSRGVADHLAPAQSDAAPIVGRSCLSAPDPLRDITRVVGQATGELWAYSGARSAIERISAQGHVVAVCQWPAAPLNVADMALGPDGTLWFIDRNARVVGHINASLRLAEYPIRWDAVSLLHTSWLTDDIFYAPPTPQHLAVADDGTVWFTNTGGIIGRLRPRIGFNRLTGVHDQREDVDLIATDPGGHVWFTAKAVDSCNCGFFGTVGVLSRQGSIQTWPDPQGGSATGLQQAGTNSVWESGLSPSIQRLSLHGVMETGTLPNSLELENIAPQTTQDLWVLAFPTDGSSYQALVRYRYGLKQMQIYRVAVPSDGHDPEPLIKDIIPRAHQNIWLVADNNTLWQFTPPGRVTPLGSL